MYIKNSFIKNKLRSLAWIVFNKLENNGNAKFDKNGEMYFLDNLFKIFNKNDDVIIFDIGANIGDYSSILLNKSTSYGILLNIHLFEPTRGCFKTISKKFQSNKNMLLNHFGASDTNCTATIFYDKDQSSLASLYQRNLENDNLTLNQSEDVSLKRIDEYIESNKIQHINFAKVDIEGHELKALNGFGKYLKPEFIDYIQFEYGGANLDSHTSLMEIYKLLTEKGFTIAKIMPRGLELRKYKPYMENFMYANYVAISNRILQK